MVCAIGNAFARFIAGEVVCVMCSGVRGLHGWWGYWVQSVWGAMGLGGGDLS